VENVDLWEELLLQMDPHQVRYEKVPGHADNAYNNRCDKLARAAAKEIAKSLENAESKPS
jgi:ribonuclease HI